jgi:hypothetical protein
LHRIVSAQGVKSGKPHSFINQGGADLDHLVLRAQVELKAGHQRIKAGLINIAFPVTAGEGGNDLNGVMLAMCKLFPEAGSQSALIQTLPFSETYLLDHRAGIK